MEARPPWPTRTHHHSQEQSCGPGQLPQGSCCQRQAAALRGPGTWERRAPSGKGANKCRGHEAGAAEGLPRRRQELGGITKQNGYKTLVSNLKSKQHVFLGVSSLKPFQCAVKHPHVAPHQHCIPANTESFSLPTGLGRPVEAPREGLGKHAGFPGTWGTASKPDFLPKHDPVNCIPLGYLLLMTACVPTTSRNSRRHFHRGLGVKLNHSAIMAKRGPE